jgi:DNA-binding MarR family transcriptional regulator
MLVSKPISLTSAQADSAPSTPIGIAIRLSAATRPVDERGNDIVGIKRCYIVIRYIVMHTGAVDVSEIDYPQLLSFRTALRRFLRWSDDAAEAEGVAPAQYQLLVVVKGSSGAPSIGQIAAELLLRHHSTSELVHRAEESGLVRTRPDTSDHRLIRVALTARGERVLAHLAPLHVEELARLAPLIAGLVR